MPTLHSIVSPLDEAFEYQARRAAFEADCQLDAIRKRLTEIGDQTVNHRCSIKLLDNEQVVIRKRLDALEKTVGQASDLDFLSRHGLERRITALEAKLTAPDTVAVPVEKLRQMERFATVCVDVLQRNEGWMDGFTPENIITYASGWVWNVQNQLRQLLPKEPVAH